MSKTPNHRCAVCREPLAPFGFHASAGGGGFAGYLWACRDHRAAVQDMMEAAPPRPVRYDSDGQGVLL